MNGRLSETAGQKGKSSGFLGICKSIFGACILEGQSESVSQSNRRCYGDLSHQESLADVPGDVWISRRDGEVKDGEGKEEEAEKIKVCAEIGEWTMNVEGAAHLTKSTIHPRFGQI